MEPITTTAIIYTIVGYLAKTLKENKTFDDFTKDFTSATINWIRPLFLVDNQPKEILEKLFANPESEAKQGLVRNTIASELEDNPKVKDYLQEMYEAIKTKETKGEAIKIVNSKNVVIGNNSVQGNFIIGDNNQTGI